MSVYNTTIYFIYFNTVYRQGDMFRRQSITQQFISYTLTQYIVRATCFDVSL